MAEDSNNTRKGYQWPADRLTQAEMAILYRLREKTGIAINRLLQLAVWALEENFNHNGVQSTNQKGDKTKQPDELAPRQAASKSDGNPPLKATSK